MDAPRLSPEELQIYQWQLDLPGFGAQAQQKLKDSTVMISRIGGVGGLVASQLAMAGVGRMVLAHGGNLKVTDLNRQILQTHAHVGRPRMEQIVQRLRALNPHLEIEAVAENVSETNAAALVSSADVVVDAAPLFEERFAMNRAAVAARKPMVECAMYAFEAQVSTILPGESPCLECWVGENPSEWRRRFPVLGAVSGAIGCLAAVEVVKLIAGLGSPLSGVLLTMDLASMEFRKLKLARRKDCPVCGPLFV